MSSHNQWKTKILRAGAFRLDGGSMFGLIPKGIWSQWTTPDDHNRIQLQCNLVLLNDGEHQVLVEVGYGEKWSPKDRSIFAMERRTAVDALHEVGVAPDSITHVILTHLHFDHAGALTRWQDPEAGDAGGFVATFPNARIMTQAQEWEDALANRSTMSRTYLKSHLEPIADRVEVLNGTGEPLPGIQVHPVPGHTWGQQAVSWSDRDRNYVFPGDLCPTRAHVHPAANMAYDVEPWTNMGEKSALLRSCVEQQRSIILDHDPETPLVDVSESVDHPGRFELLAANTDDSELL